MNEQPTKPISPLSEVINDLQKINLEDLGTDKELGNFKDFIKTIKSLVDGVRTGEIKPSKEYTPATISETENLISVLENISEQWAKKIEGKQAVRKENPPQSPDPSYGGDTMKIPTSPIPHFWGQALTASGQNTRRLRNSWESNQINGHPKFARTRITHKGGEATVYFDPKNYSALELWGKVYSIDDVVLETYTVILALMSDARNACPPGYVKEFFINPTQILNLKGFRRWGEDRRIAMGRLIEVIGMRVPTGYLGAPSLAWVANAGRCWR